MIDIDEEKRFKFFDQVFLWLGDNKLTFGDTDSGEHITMLVNKEGTLDIHKTIEGSDKKYESLTKLDLRELSKQLENDPDIIKNFSQEIMDNVKQVDFSEPEFADCKVVLVKDNEEIAKLAKKIKRKVIIDENTINEDDFIPWFEATNKVKIKALVLDKNNSSIGYLFNEKGKIFFMKGDFMVNSYFKNLIMNMATLYNSQES